jgi:hypothetical protein
VAALAWKLRTQAWKLRTQRTQEKWKEMFQMKVKAICQLVVALGIGAVMCLPATAAAAIQRIQMVPGNGTDVWTVNLVAGRPIQVLVTGDGDTDLDVFIENPFGIQVAADIGPTDNCFVRFTPLFNGKYTVKVKNLGRIANRYAMTIK